MTLDSEKPFIPHAIILTEFLIPRPIFAAALVQAVRRKKIEFEPNSHPLTYVKQVIQKLPIGVPCFGRTTGFVINYRAEHAVEFRKDGSPIARLNTALKLGETKLQYINGVQLLS